MAGAPPARNTASPSNVAKFPDDVPFLLTGTSVDRLLHGDDPAQIHIDPNAAVDIGLHDHWWTLVKHQGHVYLRGWLPAPPTADALQGATVDIDSVAVIPENADRPAEVTLRLDALKSCGYYSRTIATGDSDSRFPTMDEKFTLSDVHLDQHAWECPAGVAPSQDPTLHLSPTLIERWKAPPKPSPSFQVRDTGFTLNSYPDEKPFLLSADQVSYVMTAAAPGAMFIDPSDTDLSHPERVAKWLAIKHGGRAYLRGWVAGELDQTAATQRVVHLYNGSSPLELRGNARQISVPMDATQYRPYGRFYLKEWYSRPLKGPDNTDLIEQVILSEIRLDDYAWEKW